MSINKSKIYFLSFIFLSGFCPVDSPAQIEKPSIEITGPKNWEQLGMYNISKNGLYVMYEVVEVIDGLKREKHSVIVKSIENKWERKYIGISDWFFSSEGKLGVFVRDGDSIFLNMELNREINRQPTKSQKKEVSDKVSSEKTFKKLDFVAIIDSVNLPGVKLSICSILNNHRQKIVVFSNKNGKKDLVWEGESADSVRIGDFSKDYRTLFFETYTRNNEHLLNVSISSYNDGYNPNPYRLPNPYSKRIYALNLRTFQSSKLTDVGEDIVFRNNQYAIIRSVQGSSEEEYWNAKAREIYFQFELQSSKKRIIYKKQPTNTSEQISHTGRFLVYGKGLNYYSFDLKNNTTRNISSGQNITIRGAAHMDINVLSGVVGYIDNVSVIVYDDFDIWKLDLTGKNIPECLTNGFGKRNNIVLRVPKIDVNNVNGQKNEFFSEIPDGYLLTSFNERTKENGFFALKKLSSGNPKKLYNGPFMFNGIMRAANAGKYLLTKESTEKSPNLIVTSDFKHFHQVSSLCPEIRYNWLKAEIFRWSPYLGRNNYGILYKPENFDPQKKYPVVTLVYDGFSQYLYRFPSFTLTDFGYMNSLPIAWLVSNGYLVFLPDLNRRKVGNFLSDSRDQLLPAISKLRSLSFVNPNKIGIEGASWGGTQVNFLITQTNYFAAAFSGAGISEIISEMGYSDEYMQRIRMPGHDFQRGGLLTDVPNSYISQSSLFHAKDVTTPLLLRHGIKDSAIPYYQSLQYFRLLRRLGKKSWLLQYDNDVHGVPESMNLVDMNTRLSEFFDHYLKDRPAPNWMKSIDPIIADTKSIN